MRDDSLTATIRRAQREAERRVRAVAGEAPARDVDRLASEARRLAELQVRAAYVHR